jgi:hypothetical protein
VSAVVVLLRNRSLLDQYKQLSLAVVRNFADKFAGMQAGTVEQVAAVERIVLDIDFGIEVGTVPGAAVLGASSTPVRW